MALIESKILAGTIEIKIEIIYQGTHPVIAGYDYQLKEKNSNAVIDDQVGDNVNSQDDIYHLPTPIQDNVGRRAVITSKVAAVDLDSEFSVEIKVYQNNVLIDTLVSNGKVLISSGAVLSYDIIKFV